MGVAQGQGRVVVDKVGQAVVVNVEEIGSLAAVGIERKRVNVDASASVAARQGLLGSRNIAYERGLRAA